MSGLILKDLFTIKKEIKLFGVALIMYGVLCMVTNDYGILSIVGMLAVMTGVLTSISYDERSNWDRYAIGIKINYKDIVLSKYALSLISSVFVLVFNTIISFILGLTIEEIIQMNAIVFGGGSLVTSILIPLVFKMGAERARIVLAVIIVLPGILLMQIQKNMMDNFTIIEIINFISNNAIAVVAITAVIALSISFVISLNIYKKKEF